MPTHGQHVIRNIEGNWSVFRSGAQRASRTFAKEADAIAYARQLARRQRLALFVHKRDGSVRAYEAFDEDQPMAAAQ